MRVPRSHSPRALVFKHCCECGGAGSDHELAEVASHRVPKFELKLEVRQSGTVKAYSSGTEIAAWTFTVTPDHLPRIALTKAPERSPRGSLKLFFKVEDDYGIVSAEARIRRILPKPDTSSTAWSRPAKEGARLPYERPPVLALNFLPSDRPAPERFYQFALSPEDDARAVARYIGASGRRRGVVIAPEGDWGSRVAAAFDAELRTAGGYVLGPSTFNTAERDYGASIMQVLRTDDSRARQQRVQAAIGQKLEFEPRRRANIQFIFAPSNLPTPARLLRPQLRYHLAGDIPTYTLGDAYEPHPTANEEIEGMLFPDMPWMVGDTSLTAEVRNVAAQAFGDSGPRRGRLFAYGFDAMRLASSLQRGAPIGPDGLTGTLSMDAQGRIRRSLNWVRIKSGAPVPMDATPAITAQ